MIFVPKTSLNSSHITITDKAVMTELIDDSWMFLSSAYRWVPGGFLSFDDQEDMIDNSLAWYIIYDGEAPEPHNIDWQHVYGVTVYKQKFGLKAVAFGKQALPKPGTTPYINDKGKEITEYTMEYTTRNDKAKLVDFKKRRDSAVKAMMKDACKRGWCEVSGKPEEILISMGAYKIPAQELVDAGVFKGKQVKIEADGYHYTRMLGGQLHTKIALGRGFKV